MMKISSLLILCMVLTSTNYFLPSMASPLQDDKKLLILELNYSSDIDMPIYLAIYNREEDFLKDGAEIYSAKLLPGKENNKHEIFLTDGKYAVSLFLDENSNGKLDKNIFGYPKEAFGFSNNASGKFGPPTFNNAAFLFNIDRQIIQINLRK